MNKFSSNKINIFLIFLVVLLALILLFRIGIFQPVKNLTIKAFSPFQYFASNATDKIKDFFGTFASVRLVERENKELKEKVSNLESELAKLQNCTFENQVLKDQLGFATSTPYKLLPSSIISYQPENFLDYFTINKGKKDGINNGMAVVFSGSLVGRISDISDSTSRVNLITNTSSSINAIVQGLRTNGIVKGQVGGGLLLDMIPQNESVKNGDLVTTSALGEEFPAGILIGRIEEVRTPVGGLFQQAVLRSEIEFRKLETVFIIIGAK